MLSSGAFALGYAIAGLRFFAPMLANIITSLSCVVALFLTARGLRTLAKFAVLVPCNVAVVIVCLLLGGRVGFLYYFFLFASVAFLLFSEKQWFYRWTFSVLSAACCTFALVVVPHVAGVVTIPPFAGLLVDIFSCVAVVGTVVFIVNLFTSDTERAEERLAEEHARSERLLLNILPGVISERLKNAPLGSADREAIADGFAEVTVVFADIVGFTELSQTLDPASLVKMLNRIFSAFDDLAGRYGLEKIKTIGDCYMVASGLPSARPDHAQAAARMALGMRAALDAVNKEEGYTLRIRIGLHSGPVVAGVIGKSKFIYDLWGDTVNTASRMESSGIPDEIQVTRATYDRLKDEFDLEPRGTIKVKGKGDMETFMLRASK